MALSMGEIRDAAAAAYDKDGMLTRLPPVVWFPPLAAPSHCLPIKNVLIVVQTRTVITAYNPDLSRVCILAFHKQRHPNLKLNPDSLIPLNTNDCQGSDGALPDIAPYMTNSPP